VRATTKTCSCQNKAMFGAVFYFFFGIFLFSYLYIVCVRKSKSKNDTNKSSVVCRFYINIFFLNREEFVRNIVRSKVSKSRPLVRALAKRAAVALLSENIVEKIGQNLCKTIPERMEVMGIKTMVTIGYTQAAFLCIEVAMIGVDIPKLIGYNAGETAATKIRGILDLISFPILDKFINRTVVSLLKGKLMKQLPVTLLDKLQDKMNAEIELIVCTEEEQGPFLVNTIQQMVSSTLTTATSHTTASTPVPVAAPAAVVPVHAPVAVVPMVVVPMVVATPATD
jgi:hypothetical protein